MIGNFFNNTGNTFYNFVLFLEDLLNLFISEEKTYIVLR